MKKSIAYVWWEGACACVLGSTGREHTRQNYTDTQANGACSNSLSRGNHSDFDRLIHNLRARACVVSPCLLPLPHYFLHSGRLEVPDNAEVYAGTGTLPGTARLFKCNSGYALQGEAAVHCMQDGSWEDTPTCKEQPTTTAVTTTANPNKAWNYWRVANAGATTWVPVVSEFMLFPHTHDG